MTKCFSSGPACTGWLSHRGRRASPVARLSPSVPPPRPAPVVAESGTARGAHVRAGPLVPFTGLVERRGEGRLAGLSEELPFTAIPRRLDAGVHSGRHGRWHARPRRVRAYFDRYFEPYAVVKQTGALREETGLITGYYEPLLKGARTRSAQFNAPLYCTAAGSADHRSGFAVSGAEGQTTAGAGRGQQGCSVLQPGGRSRTGTELRGTRDRLGRQRARCFPAPGAGFGAGSAQHRRNDPAAVRGPERLSLSVHRALSRRQGELPWTSRRCLRIRQWLATHPARRDEVLNANPSYVFFNEEKIDDPSQGPKGAQGYR